MYRTYTQRLYFFLKMPRSGGEPGIFLIFRLFNLTSSALDHSATAPPLNDYTYMLSKFLV